MQHIFKYFI